MNGIKPILLCLAVLSIATGCSDAPNLVMLPDHVQPVPIADNPADNRVENWTGVSRHGHRGGSCVHASTLDVLLSIGRDDLADHWWSLRNHGYEGPETGNGILEKFREQDIPHFYTDTADTRLLEYASATHRPGIIFYYPSHCVSFREFATMADGSEVAILLDNNFPDKYIVIDRDVFERSWRYYNGFAAFPWLEPVTPRTFPRTQEI